MREPTDVAGKLLEIIQVFVWHRLLTHKYYFIPQNYIRIFRTISSKVKYVRECQTKIKTAHTLADIGFKYGMI